MTREAVRQNQLHEILNEELHIQDPCGECRFRKAPGPLRKTDKYGCNWSQDLILRQGHFWSDSCTEAASRVITQVAACFNLMPSHAAPSDGNGRRAGSHLRRQGRTRSRETYLYFQIDTNRINSRGTLAAMNHLEQWHHDGVIGLVMSDIAYTEAKAGGNAQRSRKAGGYIYSLSFEDEPTSQQAQAQIAAVVFPQGCRTPRDRNDVRICHNALRYEYVLVTADGEILRKREALAQLGLRVMTDAEAVGLVELAILGRDVEARDDAAATGASVPSWVGKD